MFSDTACLQAYTDTHAMAPTTTPRPSWAAALALKVAVAQLAPASTTPAANAAISGDGDAVVLPSRHSGDALASKTLDLLGQQLRLLVVAVAQPALASIAPAPDSSVCGDGEAVCGASQHSDDALASKGRHPRWQQLVLRVVAIAPTPDTAVGGEGEAVLGSPRNSDDALAGKCLDLLRQQLVLLVAVAQLAKAYCAPAPEAPVRNFGSVD